MRHRFGFKVESSAESTAGSTEEVHKLADQLKEESVEEVMDVELGVKFVESRLVLVVALSGFATVSSLIGIKGLRMPEERCPSL